MEEKAEADSAGERAEGAGLGAGLGVGGSVEERAEGDLGVD